MAVVERLGGCCHGVHDAMRKPESAGWQELVSSFRDSPEQTRHDSVSRQRENKKRNQDRNRASLVTAVPL